MIFLPREKRAKGLKGSKVVEVSSLISVDGDPILQRGKDKKGEKERESRRKNKWDRNTAKGCIKKSSCVCPERVLFPRVASRFVFFVQKSKSCKHHLLLVLEIVRWAGTRPDLGHNWGRG